MDTPDDIKPGFKIEETQLVAAPPTDNYNRYLADATGSLEAGGLELLLMEASGAFANLDSIKHAYDHVKSAFGCVTMLKAILKKYEFADEDLVPQLSVVFLHASGRDTCLRAWVMKPIFGGSQLSFERVLKCEIDQNPSELKTVFDTTKFFWRLKGLLEESVSALAAVKKSHEYNLSDINSDKESLRNYIRPVPMKPKKNDTSGMAGLDPSSSL